MKYFFYTRQNDSQGAQHMNDYQQEQWDALQMAVEQLSLLKTGERQELFQELAPYLAFRSEVDRFLDLHFSAHCTRSCYSNQLSACCSKDGIVAFWADMVVNVCCSSEAAIEKMFEALRSPFNDRKCTYLQADGCCWQVRPLMCAMFLCEPAQEKVFTHDESCKIQWDTLRSRAKAFRWPTRPVLFDRLETFFLDRGCRSSLMFINTSPALLRIKQKARIKESETLRRP